jgi:hypothetical protein
MENPDREDSSTAMNNETQPLRFRASRSRIFLLPIRSLRLFPFGGNRTQPVPVRCDSYLLLVLGDFKSWRTGRLIDKAGAPLNGPHHIAVSAVALSARDRSLRFGFRPQQRRPRMLTFRRPEPLIARLPAREEQSNEEPFGLPGSKGYHDAAVHGIRVICDWCCDWLNTESACASVPLSLGEHDSPNW